MVNKQLALTPDISNSYDYGDSKVSVYVFWRSYFDRYNRPHLATTHIRGTLASIKDHTRCEMN